MSVLIWLGIGFLAGVVTSVLSALFLASGDDYAVSVVDASGTSGQIWL